MSMRPIKFRAWDVEHHRFVSEPSFVRLEVTGHRPFHRHLDGGYYSQCGHVIIEQFTGLTDKNGKEIWEGDIVRFLDHNGEAITEPNHYYGGPHWKVEYSPPVFTLINGSGDSFDNGDYYRGDDIYWDRVEVIGNIHQNPELLNQS